MANLSQLKRGKMLEFLDKIRIEHQDDETLMAINEIENALTEKKYGLVWEEHTERVDEEMVHNIPIFTEIEDRKIKNSESNDYNFLIEGDNLHSLKLLEKTHRGKIDVIYIDPPYNTGNKDFIYNDMYIEKTDDYAHSKWLSFMSERLILAKKLLKDKGCIFIQISDKEVAQLKLLCDEIFGAENFLNIISVNMKNIAGASGGGEDKKLKKNCEYILIYAKNYYLLPNFNNIYKLSKMSSLIRQYDEEGKSWKYNSVLVDKGEKEYITSTVDGDGNEIKIYKRKNLKTMSIQQYANELNISKEDVYDYHWDKIFRTTMPQSSIRPRVMEKMKEIGRQEDIISIEYVPKTGRNKGILYEQFYSGEKYNLFAWLSDVTEVKDGIAYKKDLQGTYWDFTGSTKNLSKEGKVEFPNGKKSIDLLKQIIYLYPEKDIKILDFFAGSGTTGHAVIQLNKEDNGNRRYIICTNNEITEENLLKFQEEKLGKKPKKYSAKTKEILTEYDILKREEEIKEWEVKAEKLKNSKEVEEVGICKKITYKRLQNIQNELPHNLKYFKTEFIPKFSKDEENSIKYQMLNHVKELIELEYMCEIDGINNILIKDEEEFDEIVNENIKKNIRLFVSSDIFASKEQQLILEQKNIEKIEIPEYYYRNELREVGEL